MLSKLLKRGAVCGLLLAFPVAANAADAQKPADAAKAAEKAVEAPKPAAGAKTAEAPKTKEDCAKVKEMKWDDKTKACVTIK